MAVYFGIGIGRNYRCVLFAYVLVENMRAINETKRNNLRRELMSNLKMTDNLYEFRKLVLRDLMKMGYRYIARDKDGTIYAFSRKPIKQGKVWSFKIAFADGDKLKDISLVSCIFTDIEWKNEEPFRIPYTKWKEVHVDAPVVYTHVNGKKLVRYFCKYDDKNDRVVLYANGRTSLTEHGTFETCPELVSIYEKDKN